MVLLEEVLSIRSASNFNELTSIVCATYRFLGWNPTDENPRKAAKFYFFIAILYAGICFIQQQIYFAQHVGHENTFITLTNCAPCTGFVTLTLVKVSAVYGNRNVLKKLMNQLKAFSCQETFPNTQTDLIVRRSKQMMKVLKVKNSNFNARTIFYIIFFSFFLKVLYMILIWVFNLMPAFVMIYWYITDGSYQKKLPYFMWYPFDCFQPIIYEICYVFVMWGAFTCAIGILSSDLMFCAVITLICMRFNVLKSKIRKVIDGKLPKEEFKKWIDDHNEIMMAVDKVEGIFSVSILVNFVGSSLTICLVGFQTFVS
jgi:odorant receptor